MANHSQEPNGGSRPPWWRSIGPGLITACVVFGPGSLLVNSNVGARYGYELLWLIILTAILMGTFITMGARIGVAGSATPCTLIARRLGRPAAAVVGINLCLICGAFQFSNNIAFALAASAFVPAIGEHWIYQAIVLATVNGIIIVFLLTAREVYRILERVMKVMVALILTCFVINLFVAGPELLDLLNGFVPGIPEDLKLGLPKRVGGEIRDPMLLIAGLMGTTFSVAGAFYQGNLVREKGWAIREYKRGIGDALAGVSVLACVSLVIMMTTATVIQGQPATDIRTLAESLQPLLGPIAYPIFCLGLIAVAANPFLINAMIGGSILADGIGKPPRLSDRWPRILTILMLLLGMVVAIMALRSGEKPVNLIILGQALTVLGNPLMAVSMLWLANRKDVMGDHRNGVVHNVLGGTGLVVVLLMAIRVLWIVVLKLS